MPRDDFPAPIIAALGKRVGYFCSNPDCGRPTVGPHTNPGKWTNLGVAAHIVAAAPKGPRADPSLSPDQRKDISNGIWLCQACAKLIDDDPEKYSVELLRKWKADKEARLEALLKGTERLEDEGALVASTPLMQLGNMGAAQFEDGRQIRTAHLLGPNEDPAAYCSAFVFRSILKPLQSKQPTILQALGIDVLSCEPVPPHKPMMAAYPAEFSLYLLPFDDPKSCGASRFMAEKFYRVQAGTRSEELPYQPMVLEGTEIVDCRLWPKAAGLYRLRIFAVISAGMLVKEHDLISSITVLVPEPVIMDGEMVTPNCMI